MRDPWKIFEQELYMQHHGHPIWKADLDRDIFEVQIGDVGYM